MTRWPKCSTYLLVLTLVLLVAAPQSGLTPGTGFRGSSAAQAAGPEPLRVAITPPLAPWTYTDQSGKLTGFEVELLREIGRRLNREVQFIPVQWDGIFAGLPANKYDIIASNVTLTCARAQLFGFSVPYYDNGLSITTLKSDKRIRRVQDLTGMVVGVGGAGTVGHLWLLANRWKYGIKDIKVYEGEGYAALLDLQAGRVDAVVGDYPTSSYYVRDKPSLDVRVRDLTTDYSGMVFRKGDPLIDQVNTAIDAMKKDGTMARIHREQLGFAAPASSAMVRVIPPVVFPSACK